MELTLPRHRVSSDFRNGLCVRAESDLLSVFQREKASAPQCYLEPDFTL